MSFIKTVLNKLKRNTIEKSNNYAEEETKNQDIIKNLNVRNDRDAKDITIVSDEEEYEIVEREILPAKIICPDCGGITLEGLEFCDKCGGELQ